MRLLFTSLLYSELENCLLENLQQQRLKNSLQPILLLVPNHSLKKYLIHKVLHKIDAVNIHSFTFAELIDEIHFAADMENYSTLPSFVADFLCRELAQKITDGYFADVAKQQGFANALATTIAEMKAAGICARQFAKIANRVREQEKIMQIASLFLGYEAKLRAGRLYDPADAIHSAGKLINRTWLRSISTVFIYGFIEFAYVQKKFLQSLFPKKNTLIFLPHCHKPIYDPITKLINWLQRDCFVWHQISDCQASPFLQQVFAAPAQANAVCEQPEIALISNADIVLETEDIARSILHYATRGKKLSQICILPRNFPLYSQHLVPALENCNLPHALVKHTLASTHEARLFMAILQILTNDFTRETIFELAYCRHLQHAAILPVELHCGFVPDEWHWFCKDFTMLRGSTHWKQLIEIGLLEGFDGKHYPRYILEAFHAFVDFWAQTITYLQQQRSYRSLLSGLLTIYTRVCQETPLRAFIIKLLNSLTLIEGVIDFSVDKLHYFVLLALKQELPSVDVAADVDKVFIGDLEDAVGIPFAVSIFPGLIEKEFPKPVLPSPLLTDGDRIDINRLLSKQGQLKLTRDSANEEKLLFHLAICANGGNLELHFPRRDSIAEKEYQPSPFVLEIASCATQNHVNVESLRLCKLLRYKAADTYLDDDLCGARHTMDYDLKSLYNALQTNSDLLPLLLHHHPFLRTATLNLQRRWYKSSFSEYEGVIREPDILEALKHFAPQYQEQVPVSLLETYAICPFLHFMRYILQIPGRRNSQLLPLPYYKQRQMLIDILMRTALASVEKSSRQVLADTVAEIYDSFPHNSFYPEMLWDIEQQKMLENLQYYLDMAATGESQPKSQLFNVKYGASEQRGVEVLLDTGRKIAFGGVVNHVNLFEQHVEAFQYSLKPASDNFSGGETLALAVHMLALHSLFPNMPIKHICQHSFQNDGTWKEVYLPGEPISEIRKKLKAICDKIVYGIDNGFFFPAPTEKKCRFCTYIEVCGVMRHATFAYKHLDPRITFFSELKEIK